MNKYWLTTIMCSMFLTSFVWATEPDNVNASTPHLSVGVGGYGFYYNGRNPAGGPRLSASYWVLKPLAITLDMSKAWTNNQDDGIIFGFNALYKWPSPQRFAHGFILGAGCSVWFQNDNLPLPRLIIGYGFQNDYFDIRIAWEPSLGIYKSVICSDPGGCSGYTAFINTTLFGFSLMIGFLFGL